MQHWDFFRILLLGMGFEHWEVGFREEMGWEMGLVPPPPPMLQDPLTKQSSNSCCVYDSSLLFYCSFHTRYKREFIKSEFSQPQITCCQ